MNPEQRAEIMLETAATCFAVQVQNEPETPEAHFAHVSGARGHLHHSALGYAAALGDLAAGERAEMLALRRFRDGIVALRQELYDDARSTASLAIETIDAMLVLNGVAP